MPSRFGSPRGSIPRILREAGEISDARMRSVQKYLDDFTATDDPKAQIGGGTRLTRNDFGRLLQSSPDFQQQVANRWVFATPREREALLVVLRDAFPERMAPPWARCPVAPSRRSSRAPGWAARPRGLARSAPRPSPGPRPVRPPRQAPGAPPPVPTMPAGPVMGHRPRPGAALLPPRPWAWGRPRSPRGACPAPGRPAAGLPAPRCPWACRPGRRPPRPAGPADWPRGRPTRGGAPLARRRIRLTVSRRRTPWPWTSSEASPATWPPRAPRCWAGTGATTTAKAAADEAERQRKEAEAQARRQAEEAERLAEQQAQQARIEAQKAQAKAWFDQAMGAARDTAMQAAGAVGERFDQAGTAVRERADDLGRRRPRTWARPGTSSSSAPPGTWPPTRARRSPRPRRPPSSPWSPRPRGPWPRPPGTTGRGATAPRPRAGSPGTASGSATPAGGASSRPARADDERRGAPTSVREAVERSDIAGILGATDQATRDIREEEALVRPAQEAENRVRAERLRREGLGGLWGNLTGGRPDTPEGRAYAEYQRTHGGAPGTLGRMAGAGIAGALGVAPDVEGTGQYRPQEGPEGQPRREGLQKALGEAGEQWGTVRGTKGEGLPERAAAGLGLGLQVFNVPQEMAKGFVGRASGDPAGAEAAGLFAAVAGPGGIDVGDARAMAGSLWREYRRSALDVTGRLPRAAAAVRGVVGEHGLAQTASTGGVGVGSVVGAIMGTAAYRDAKAKGATDEVALAQAIQVGGLPPQVGELAGLAVRGLQGANALRRGAQRLAPDALGALRRLAGEERGEAGPPPEDIGPGQSLKPPAEPVAPTPEAAQPQTPLAVPEREQLPPGQRPQGAGRIGLQREQAAAARPPGPRGSTCGLARGRGPARSSSGPTSASGTRSRPCATSTWAGSSAAPRACGCRPSARPSSGPGPRPTWPSGRPSAARWGPTCWAGRRVGAGATASRPRRWASRTPTNPPGPRRGRS